MTVGLLELRTWRSFEKLYADGLRWHLQNGTIVIPKSVTPHRIESNFDVFSFELDDDQMVELTGVAVADPDQQVSELRQQVHSLAEDLSSEDLPGMQWPLYGALIANLQMIIDVVDAVATAQPVRT